MEVRIAFSLTFVPFRFFLVTRGRNSSSIQEIKEICLPTFFFKVNWIFNGNRTREEPDPFGHLFLYEARFSKEKGFKQLERIILRCSRVFCAFTRVCS